MSLDRSQDNPQLIFESMNSTGRELSQADLIRNFILMGLEPKLQTELYKNYWRPMEKGFGQAAYAVHFDAFMRHYLTTKTGEIPNVGDGTPRMALLRQRVGRPARGDRHEPGAVGQAQRPRSLGLPA